MSLLLDTATLRAGDRILCEGLSLQVAPGEIWAVLGENGAGKSTLLRAMAGLDAPAAGTIALQGRGIAQWPPRERARLLAWMSQSDDDGFAATVMDCLLGARYPWATSWARETVADERLAIDHLQQVDLDGFGERQLTTLSGGERRRVALASALMQDTPYRLLDEPLSALDPRHQSSMLALIRSKASADGATVFTTHDPNHALAIATHVLAIGVDATWQGPASTLLDARFLTTLYGCEIELVEQAGRRAFVIGA